MSGFIAFSYNLDMKIKGPSSRCRSDPYTQVGFLPCYGIGNILTILFSLHQLYKMQRISSFPEESDRLRCFVLVTTPLFTRLRFLQTIRTFAKFKSLLFLPAFSCWMRSEKSAKHGYFESESFNDVLSPLPSVRLMREEIKLEFSAFFRLAATPAPLFWMMIVLHRERGLFPLPRF